MAGIFRTIAAGLERKADGVTRVGRIEEIWADLFGGGAAKSGVSVNFDKALQVTTVLGCTRVLAEGVAQLPLKVYREEPSGAKTPAKDHPSYRLLARRPNDWLTSFEFREMLMIHAVLNGNGYAIKSRVRGEVKELLPVMSHRVTVRQARDLDLRYEIRDDQGLVDTFPREEIMHLRGPSQNSYLGMDCVRLAREAIGLAIATEEAHARLHANGAQPGGILAVDGSMSDATYKRIKAQIEDSRSGLHNAFRTWVLDQGAKWHPLAMKGVDAQHIETRRHQIEAICHAMRVPPVMLGYPADIAARAAMEQMFIAFVVYYLMPWLVRWEQMIARDLLDDSPDLIAKFTVAGLMRGALKDQGEYFARALGSGGSPAWLTQDEVRDYLELNPFGGTAALLPTPTNPGVPPADGEGDQDEPASL